MNAKEIAENSGVKLWKVYALAKKYGRLPTPQEIKESNQKRGRPQKYEIKKEQEENV